MLGDASAGELIVAGPLVRLACERHLNDRAAGVWRFSAEAADTWIGFFEHVLRLPDKLDDDGNPSPFLLEPAQAFIVGSLFGWMGDDGYRRFRDAFLEMGKGNGKTPLLAGVGLGGLTLDGEPAPEIYAAAVTRDQAGIMHRDAVRMRDASPELSDIRKTVNNLAYGLGFFRPFSRDQGIKSGPRPHMALIDEVHEHPSAEVINKLRAGFKFRKQPMAIEITNSGFDRTSICWQHRQHAENVLRGLATDDRLFAYVCALDDGDDPLTDEACWVKANPLIGVTITREYLARQVENAKNIPHELNTVLRLNFCIWTHSEQRAIDMGQWAACKPLPPDSALASKPCFAGMDMGQTDDISALARVWDMGDGRYAVKMHYWIPEASLKKYPHRPYAQWVRAGVLTVTRGNPTTTDYDAVEAEAFELCRSAGVRQVAYDKTFMEQMAQHLTGRGLTMVDTRQGFYLNEALRLLLKSVADGNLCHGNDPILSWMASNAVTREGLKGDIRLDKESSPDKIDGIAALQNAMDRIVRAPVNPGIQFFVAGRK